MDRLAGQSGTAGRLHPESRPYDQRMVDRGDGHEIYVEQCGNPAGQPVLVLHGGPGGGCSPFMRRFFDPAHYRIVLFDQRGCGRSRPIADVQANTTQHLIADIEAIRALLDIPSWIVFGGSWGATLALAYAQSHPAPVQALILRGVFLGTQAELDWFYGGGAGRFFPDIWAGFTEVIPQDEHGDLIAAYHRRLFDDDTARQTRFAQPWLAWENTLAGLEIRPGTRAPVDYARAFARLENHYFANGCFLEPDQLIRDRHLIEHIPAVIVQGRYDMVCPPISAWRLADGWAKCDLRIIPAAGHALSEPGIAAALVGIMNQLRQTFERAS